MHHEATHGLLHDCVGPSEEEERQAAALATEESNADWLIDQHAWDSQA